MIWNNSECIGYKISSQSHSHTYVCRDASLPYECDVMTIWYTRNSYLSYILNLNISAFLLIIQLHPSIHIFGIPISNEIMSKNIHNSDMRKETCVNECQHFLSIIPFRSVPNPYYKYCWDIINSPEYNPSWGMILA